MVILEQLMHEALIYNGCCACFSICNSDCMLVHLQAIHDMESLTKNYIQLPLGDQYQQMAILLPIKDFVRGRF